MTQESDLTPPRIRPIDMPLEGITAQRMSKLIPPELAPPQLYLTTARHAKLWAFMVDSGFIGPTGLMDLRSLPPRLRELVLLRTCVANRCHYEFNLHVQTISERMGLTPALIDDIRQLAPASSEWSAAERAAIGLVDALVLKREVTDAVFDSAREHFDDVVLIEITHLVGLYTGVAMMAALTLPRFDLYRSAEPVLAEPHP